MGFKKAWKKLLTCVESYCWACPLLLLISAIIGMVVHLNISSPPLERGEEGDCLPKDRRCVTCKTRRSSCSYCSYNRQQRLCETFENSRCEFFKCRYAKAKYNPEKAKKWTRGRKFHKDCCE